MTTDPVSSPGSSPASSQASTSPAYRLYVLLLLTGVYTFNFLDRQIMGILAPAIQDDLGLSDGQLGILYGLAFAVLYTCVGIPIARLADRYNRVTIVSLSLAAWSGFTAICGFAQNFTQLALARVGVGIGEAGGTPPAHSIISDLYPKEQRAGALGIYALGIPIGVTLAYLSVAYIQRYFDWRTTFFILGVPGVLLAVLLRLTVREPARGNLETTSGGDNFKDTKLVDFGMLLRAAKHLLTIPTYAGVLAGQTLASFTSYATSGFIVIFFARSHPELARFDLLLWLALINGTAYVLGVLVGGKLVDQRAAKDKSAYGYIPALGLALCIPFACGALWIGNPLLSLLFWWPVHFLTGFHLGPCFALAQTLAPVSIRALSTSIYFFILNLIALGLGPTSVGILSDVLSSQFGMSTQLALRIALSALGIPLVLAIIAFVWAAGKVKADWAKATGDAS